MPKTIEVFDPVGLKRAKALTPAPRVADLKDKIIGLLDNTKPGADLLLDRTEELLKQNYGVTQFIRKRKLTNGSPASREIIQELAEKCNAIVNALGD